MATATRVHPMMTLNTTCKALSRTPTIIRNRMIGLSVSIMARLLNQGAIIGSGGWTEEAPPAPGSPALPPGLGAAEGGNPTKTKPQKTPPQVMENLIFLALGPP